MNLVNALKKTAKEERKELEKLDPITEATRLLESKSAQDREILRAMGMKNYNTIKKDNLRGRKIELERARKEANSEVYTIDEIQAIAIKYRLKFLVSDRYRGIIDSELPVKVREFCEKQNLPLSGSNLQYRFYILAPYQAFHLEERPPAPKDPVMFYQVDSKHYQIVHQWGGDLTFMNRVKGFYLENATQFNGGNIFMAIMLVNVVMAVLGLFGGYDMALHVAALVIVPFVTFLIFAKPSGSFMFTPQSWNSKDRE